MTGRIYKKFFCHHEYTRVKHLYGDDITIFGCRTLKICWKCGKMLKRDLC